MLIYDLAFVFDEAGSPFGGFISIPCRKEFSEQNKKNDKEKIPHNNKTFKAKIPFSGRSIKSLVIAIIGIISID
jgi:hypothetical protein